MTQSCFETDEEETSNSVMITEMIATHLAFFSGDSIKISFNFI